MNKYERLMLLLAVVSLLISGAGIILTFFFRLNTEVDISHAFLLWTLRISFIVICLLSVSVGGYLWNLTHIKSKLKARTKCTAIIYKSLKEVGRCFNSQLLLLHDSKNNDAIIEMYDKYIFTILNEAKTILIKELELLCIHYDTVSASLYLLREYSDDCDDVVSYFDKDTYKKRKRHDPTLKIHEQTDFMCASSKDKKRCLVYRSDNKNEELRFGCDYIATVSVRQKSVYGFLSYEIFMDSAENLKLSEDTINDILRFFATTVGLFLEIINKQWDNSCGESFSNFYYDEKKKKYDER
jgi:hypothetical protein